MYNSKCKHISTQEAFNYAVYKMDIDQTVRNKSFWNDCRYELTQNNKSDVNAPVFRFDEELNCQK